MTGGMPTTYETSILWMGQRNPAPPKGWLKAYKKWDVDHQLVITGFRNGPPCESPVFLRKNGWCFVHIPLDDWGYTSKTFHDLTSGANLPSLISVPSPSESRGSWTCSSRPPPATSATLTNGARCWCASRSSARRPSLRRLGKMGDVRGSSARKKAMWMGFDGNVYGDFVVVQWWFSLNLWWCYGMGI